LRYHQPAVSGFSLPRSGPGGYREWMGCRPQAPHGLGNRRPMSGRAFEVGEIAPYKAGVAHNIGDLHGIETQRRIFAANLGMRALCLRFQKFIGQGDGEDYPSARAGRAPRRPCARGADQRNQFFMFGGRTARLCEKSRSNQPSAWPALTKPDSERSLASVSVRGGEFGDE